MTDITITLPDPAQTVELLHNAARHAGGTGWDHKSAQHTDWLARQITAAIEEQVKPAVDDLPAGSLIRARVTRWSSAAEWPDDTSNVIMRRSADGYWNATDGDPSAPFAVVPSRTDHITITEVLRVGIGEPVNVHEFMTEAGFTPSPSQDASEKKGWLDGHKTAKRVILANLRQLRAEAITSERKNAYDVAIATVEGLQP